MLLLGLVLLDALIGPSRRRERWLVEAPAVVGVGAGGTLTVARPGSRDGGAAPAELAVETNARLATEPAHAVLSFAGAEGVSADRR